MYLQFHLLFALSSSISLIGAVMQPSADDIRILQDMMRGGNGYGQMIERDNDPVSSPWK